jgi:hypothetical protein
LLAAAACADVRRATGLNCGLDVARVDAVVGVQGRADDGASVVPAEGTPKIDSVGCVLRADALPPRADPLPPSDFTGEAAVGDATWGFRGSAACPACEDSSADDCW